MEEGDHGSDAASDQAVYDTVVVVDPGFVDVVDGSVWEYASPGQGEPVEVHLCSWTM